MTMMSPNRPVMIHADMIASFKEGTKVVIFLEFSCRWSSVLPQLLFSSAKTSKRDERKELAGTQDKRSARSIQKYEPRPPAGYAQKKVSNSIATDQVSRIPKKSQPSLPMVPRSTSSVSNISKPNKKFAPVKTEQTCRVEGLLLKSKIKPTCLTKSSGPNIEKDVDLHIFRMKRTPDCYSRCQMV